MATCTDSTYSSPLSSPPSTASSSPLSSLASTPEPPSDLPPLLLPRPGPYPSPPASQKTSQSGSPAPDGVESGTTTDREGPPPAKRRRISKDPRVRSTQYLDLRSEELDTSEQLDLQRVLRVLHKHQKIVVIAGAGMSVAAGIPDFRSSTGLFQSLKEQHKLKGSGKHLFDASVYKDDTSTSSFHSMVSSMSRLTKVAKPTAFHHMLATIAVEDRLLRLYSQNVDGLDTSLPPLNTCVPLRKDAAGKWPRTVQLHGGLDKMVCSKCHELSDFDAGLFSGPVPPLCQTCEQINEIRTTFEGKRSHGIGRLRPRMVLYNEHNPDDEAIGAVTREDLRKRPDAVIVVGTTLKVPGVRRIVREMCSTVRDRRGGIAIWINNDLPPVARDLEDCFDIIVRSNCDEVAKHAAMRKWDEAAELEDYCEISEEDAQKASEKKGEVHVHVPKCPLSHANIETLPTAQHLNNSFPPPPSSITPKKAMEIGPLDWSPISSRRSSVVPSIEIESLDAENINVATGLLTPSKSQRSSPVKRMLTVNNELKYATTAGKSAAKKPKSIMTTKTKKPNVKYVKPHPSKVKTAEARSKSRSKAIGLMGIFKTSKVGSAGIKGLIEKALPAQAMSPSKLRQVSNVVEPIDSQLPRDARSDILHLKPKVCFPGLATDE